MLIKNNFLLTIFFLMLSIIEKHKKLYAFYQNKKRIVPFDDYY